MIDKILGRTKMLEKALDATWLRNEAISQNIANVDTPGYKRKTVKFEEYLNNAMDESSFKGTRKDPRHIPIGSDKADNIDIRVTQDNSTNSMRLDGNNVDIDSEMSSLAKNQIEYNTLVQTLNARFNRLKSAIKGGA